MRHRLVAMHRHRQAPSIARLDLRFRRDPASGPVCPRFGGFGFRPLEFVEGAGELSRKRISRHVAADKPADPVVDGVGGIPARPVLVIDAAKLVAFVDLVGPLRLGEEGGDGVGSILTTHDRMVPAARIGPPSWPRRSYRTTRYSTCATPARSLTDVCSSSIRFGS